MMSVDSSLSLHGLIMPVDQIADLCRRYGVVELNSLA